MSEVGYHSMVQSNEITYVLKYSKYFSLLLHNKEYIEKLLLKEELKIIKTYLISRKFEQSNETERA